MKQCEKNCAGWRQNSSWHFGLNSFGNFALLNYGIPPNRNCRTITPNRSISSDSVTHCPWCGARLVYGDKSIKDNKTLRENKNRLEALEEKTNE